MKKILSMFLALALAFSLFVPNIVKANDNQTINVYSVNTQGTFHGTESYVKTIANTHYFVLFISAYADVNMTGNRITGVRAVGAYHNFGDYLGIYPSNVRTLLQGFDYYDYYVDVYTKVTFDILTESTGDYLYRDQYALKTVKADER